MFLVQGNRERMRGAGHNCEKYIICLFHVSEHVDHFKTIQIFHEKKQEIVWFPVIFFEGFPYSNYGFG